jgi:23S rRNA-/tRNA-specific pseudouridylate synthase
LIITLNLKPKSQNLKMPLHRKNKRIPANGMDLTIISMEPGWIAVEKPSHMSIHNQPGKDLCSLVLAHLKNEPEPAECSGCDFSYGVHAVNRLDKQTSGVVMLACRPDTFRFLSSQFENREVEKVYFALLHGSFESGHETGIWNWPLTKKAEGGKFPQGKGKRVASATRYRIIETSPHYTMAELSPLTGRKHQIRRHARLAGHPVAGDNRYGTVRSLRYLKSQYGFNRLALHCMSITLKPPGKKIPETFTSTGIPEDIKELFNMDRLIDAQNRPG